MIQTQAGYHSDKTQLLLNPSYGTTAYSQALAYHLLLHVSRIEMKKIFTQI